MKAYKFRGISEMNHLFDILINRQLYCADWKSLNDPVEGLFVTSGLSSAADYVEKVIDKKRPLRVCSLSRTFDCHLLWAHYAAGFTGVAIEVELDPNAEEVVEVTYRGVFAALQGDKPLRPSIAARKVLSSKYQEWSYEKEVRILTTASTYKLEKPISRVIVGHRMPVQTRKALQIICSSLEIPIYRTGIGDEGIDADYIE